MTKRRKGKRGLPKNRNICSLCLTWVMGGYLNCSKHRRGFKQYMKEYQAQYWIKKNL